MSVLAAACSDYANDTPGGNPQSGADRHTVTLRATHDTTTRTDFDGTVTSWVEGDAMSVILDNGVQQQACRFTLTDAAEGIFEGDIASFDPDAAYDVYAVYPYNELKTTASDKNDKALFDIGAASQTQHGTSASHVAACDPLTGSVESVSLDNISLRMHHTATLIRLDIHNDTGNAITGITSAKITAPTSSTLAAAHKIDLTNGTVTADDDQKSNTIELTVEESGEIAAGAAFTLWAAAAPFTITEGQTLNIDITTADGIHYGAVKAFSTEKSFAAGTIMSTTVNLGTESQTRMVSIDFTSADSYPDTFPTSAKTQPQTSTHYFDDLAFTFDCPENYYYNSNSGCLTITGITQSSTARITIPAIEGYAPTRIEITLDGSITYNNSFITSVTDNSGNLLDNTKELRTYKQECIYEPTGTNDKDTYCIHIGSQSKSKTTPYKLQSLEITYTPCMAK